jgi:hypothetical protein
MAFSDSNPTPSAEQVNQAHTNSDVDKSRLSQHHTLGTSATQASAGNHNHDGISSVKIKATDIDGDIPAANGLPTGGTANQIIVKDSSTDYDVSWSSTIDGDNLTIKTRRDTQANWASTNPVLAVGQMGYETDTGLVKHGDGSNAWNSLGYTASSTTTYLVANQSGATILKGTLVSAVGTEATGRIDVAAFSGYGTQDSEMRVMGLLLTDIANSGKGTVISFGTLRNIDTRGSVASALAVGDETWAAGDILYAHPTVAGKLTKVRPQHDLTVAFVTKVDATTGQLAIRIHPGNNHLEWMHDVSISSAANGDLLKYDSATSLWKNSAQSTLTIAPSQVTGTAVITTDSRLSDARTPTAHASTHASGGSDQITIAPSQVTGTAVITTDSRLSDARTPTAHAASHASGGSDAITVAQSQVTGLTTALSGKASTTHASTHASGGSDAITIAQSQVTSLVSDLSNKATTTHVHGYISNTGTLATPVTATNPVKVVITNSSDTVGTLLTTGASSSTFLRGDGTWNAPPAATIKVAANRTTSAGGSALAANAQETATTVTFPSGRFSTTPSVVASTSSVRYVAAINSASSTGFTLLVRNVSDATGTTYTWNYQAIEIISGMGT